MSALRRRREPRQEIERRVGTDLRVARQVKVPGGGTDVPVAEQSLNGMQVNAGFQQVRGEGVAEPMNAPRLADAGGALRDLIHPWERGGMQRLTSSLRRKHPRSWTSDPPVLAERIEQPRRQDGVAVLAALAVLDADRHARRIDVTDAQVQHLIEP